MNIYLIIGIIALLIGLSIVVILRKSDSDLKDFLYISGYWFVLFSLPLIMYSFLHFNPKHFVWIGIIIGLIVSIINLYVSLNLTDRFSRDKYSGGGLTYLSFGCIGLIAFPLIGFGLGFALKVLMH